MLSGDKATICGLMYYTTAVYTASALLCTLMLWSWFVLAEGDPLRRMCMVQGCFTFGLACSVKFFTKRTTDRKKGRIEREINLFRANESNKKSR